MPNNRHDCHLDYPGIPTLCYGLAGLLWAKHTEKVRVKSEVEGEVVEVTVYFWYQESPGAKH